VTIECENVRPFKLLYRVDEACDALGIGRTSLYEEVRAKRLTLSAAAGRKVIHWEDLKAYADARRAEAIESRHTIH
jgi:excisionase family DNA binding protein